MNWFEKIKSMNEDELSIFLADFDISDIDNSYCENGCEEKTDDGNCKHEHNCPYSDSFVIKMWLNTKAD